VADGPRVKNVVPAPTALAEKKLRQAEFFLDHLRNSRMPGRSDETMEFYLSASLTAVQSAFYVKPSRLRTRTSRCLEQSETG
jgi:hypothetical protein